MTEERHPGRPGQPVRLLQFTDLHLCGDESERVRGVATSATFERCLVHARDNQESPDAVLLTGDLVQDDPRGYLALARLMADTEVPVYCLPGNHDVPGEMQSLLACGPFDLSPAIRLGAWTLLQLDTAVPGSHRGRLSDDSLGFLDDTLRRSAGTHALLALHHQPVPVGSRWLDAIGLDNAADLLEVVAQHRNLRGLVWGHIHQAFDGMLDGRVLMGTPSTCFQFVPRREGLEMDDRPPGYRWLHLHPDGRIDSGVVWLPQE